MRDAWGRSSGALFACLLGLAACDSTPVGEAGATAAAPAGAASGGAPALTAAPPVDDGVGALVKTGKPLYSQQREELIIRDFFEDREGGFFLDVGAGHYKRYSTTFYLEEKLGWSGISVDAIADYAADYAKHRPKTTFVNYLVTDTARGPQTFYRADALPEVSSATKQVATEQSQRYRGTQAVTEVEVPSITLNELLDEKGVEKVDFLSMDIEEHEPEALRGFDVKRFAPDLVCIEAHEAVQEPILEYFESNGYERIDRYLPYDQGNWYFTPKKKAKGE